MQYDITSPDSGFIANLRVTAHRPSNGDWRAWNVAIAGKRDGSGAAALGAGGLIPVISAQGSLGSAGWSIDIQINGSQNYTLDVIGTGQAGATINWAAEMAGVHAVA